MFRNILVCSDGSEGALSAVRAAAALAERFGSQVRLLDAFNPAFLEADGLGVWSMAVPAETVESIAGSQHQAVVQGAAPLLDAAGVSYQATQERGHPVGVIADAARREQADLVVVGSRGTSGLRSLAIGSVSEGVLHHAPCSVLLLRANAAPEEEKWFARMLLASDASEGAAKATAAAFVLAQKFESALTILNVYEKPGLLAETADAFAAYYPEDHAKRVMQAVEQSADRERQESHVPCVLRQETGHPAETVLRVAQEERADLVVVGSRGLGGFQSLLMGSVSNNVAGHASCSVLVVR